MGFLTDQMDNCIQVSGRTFKINPAFDVVLEIQKLYREEELNDVDKLEQSLNMLVVRGKLQQLSISEKTELLKAIYAQCISIRKHPPGKQGPPVLDFELDGEYIYASFMLDYRIDLVDEQGILSWKKFIALFQGLSEKTKIREVMRIRGRKIPKYNGHNSEEIQQINELKSFYALPVHGGGGKKGLDLLFNTLESMAVKKGGEDLGEKR